MRNPGDRAEEPGKVRMLVRWYPHGQDLEGPVAGFHWKASPATRMMELLHATDVRLGLVTNGERWMLVDAPRGETTGSASWYASLWIEEPITLRALRSLLSGLRFFAVSQDVTDRLGYQVRRAVEVLIQELDHSDQDYRGEHDQRRCVDDPVLTHRPIPARYPPRCTGKVRHGSGPERR